jgi:hypothetical protein
MKRNINEVSADFMKRAEQAQRERLKDEKVLKSITAWQYLKSLKRADDFHKYAEKISAAVRKNNIGSPKDPKVNLDEVGGTTTERTISGTVPSESCSKKGRFRQIKETRQRTGAKMEKFDNPTVPVFPDGAKIRKGHYTIIYISSMDDDVAAVWTDANSINSAIQDVLHQFWDIKEIIDVHYEGKGDADNDTVFDISELDSVKNLGTSLNETPISQEEISQKMTNGEFNDINEIVADIKDDETTENCPAGNIYEGVDVDGNEWSGNKSSYREILDNNTYDTTDDYDIEIVTEIDLNESGVDKRMMGTFNLFAFQQALKKGIVHFVYMKKDGTERQAFGTTSQQILQKNGVTPSGAANTRTPNPNVIVYYDLNSHAWRSCLKRNITMIYDESYS